MNPTFSIITVSFNAENTIAKTVNSVLSQKFDDFEIIIKDGLSNDKTIESIPKDNRIRVIRTSDNGIYDAMNQAITYCSGKFICFLNCGDTLRGKDVLGKLYCYITSNTLLEENCIIYGNCSRKGTTFIQPDNITDFYLFRRPINHQSMFFSSKVFKYISYYDTSFRICADYELTVKAFFCGIKFYHINEIIADYEGGGVSEKKETRRLLKEEYEKVTKTHFPRNKYLKYKIILLLSLRKIRSIFSSDSSPLIIRELYNKMANIVNR